MIIEKTKKAAPFGEYKKALRRALQSDALDKRIAMPSFVVEKIDALLNSTNIADKGGLKSRSGYRTESNEEGGSISEMVSEMGRDKVTINFGAFFKNICRRAGLAQEAICQKAAENFAETGEKRRLPLEEPDVKVEYLVDAATELLKEREVGAGRGRAEKK